MEIGELSGFIRSAIDGGSPDFVQTVRVEDTRGEAIWTF